MSQRPENAVLLCIARRDLDAGKQNELHGLLEHKLDWDYLLAMASKHKLVPLLQKNLTAPGSNRIPGQVLARLKRESVENSQSTLYLIGKLLELHSAFKQNDIPVAVFKGPVLAQMAYGDVGLRQAGDIDMLISRQHFARAKELLESLGYQMSPQLTPSQQASHLRFHCEITFMRDEWFTVVDLHWGLTPRSFVFNLDADEVMTRLQPISIAGTPIETFGIEDLIIYQSMHGAKHLWQRLEGISALAELLRSSAKVAWPTLVARAARARGTRMLGLGLRLAEEFSDVGIPADVFAAIDGDNRMKRMASEIQDQLFAAYSGPPDSTDTNLYNLKIMDRKRDALASMLRAILVPTISDWQALALPEALHPLYYAFRPLRLSKTYGSSLWQKLTRRITREQPFD